jgi:hypothetical protein
MSSKEFERLVSQLAELATSQVSFNVNLQRNVTALMAATVSMISAIKATDPEMTELLEKHLEAQKKLLDGMPDLDCSEQLQNFLNVLRHSGPPPGDDHPTPPWFKGIVDGGRDHKDNDES